MSSLVRTSPMSHQPTFLQLLSGRCIPAALLALMIGPASAQMGSSQNVLAAETTLAQAKKEPQDQDMVFTLEKLLSLTDAQKAEQQRIKDAVVNFYARTGVNPAAATNYDGLRVLEFWTFVKESLPKDKPLKISQKVQNECFKSSNFAQEQAVVRAQPTVITCLCPSVRHDVTAVW